MNIFNLFSQSKELTDNLGSKALEIFTEMTLEEKVLLVLTEDVDFLGHDSNFSPSDGDVSMYDHLHIDRGAGADLDELIERALQDFTDEGLEKEATYILNTMTPLCCVIRDMLEQNLYSFTYDW